MSNTPTINAAVIGTGFMGAAHVEGLRRVPGVAVRAVTSGQKARAEALAGQFGIPNAYDDWRRVLDDPEITVVHNCTPNHLHYEINKAALEAGKHVVSEKPLTNSSAEAAELVALAEQSGRVNAVNFNYRMYPLIQQARHLVASGDTGAVHLVHGQYVQDWLLFETDYNWRLEPEVGGPSRALADIGSHWCDLVQFVTGLRITAVFADLFRVHDQRRKPSAQTETFKQSAEAGEAVDVGTEDGATMLLRFENGARGAVTISQVSAGRKNHQGFEIDGAKKALAWQQERPNELWIGHRDRPNEVLARDASLMAECVASYTHYPGGHPEGYPDGFKNMFLRVYEHVRDPADPAAYPTFADGLRAVRIVEAALKSSAEERWVDVG